MKGKKLLSLAVVLVMLFVMAVPAMAADTTITVKGATAGATYYAYKLFDFVDNSEGSVEAYTYTINENYRSVLITALELDPSASTQGIIAAIAALEDALKTAEENAAEVRKFADAAYREILKDNNLKDGDVEPIIATGDSVLFTVPQGYWLIAEVYEDSAAPAYGDTYSLVMLRTAGEESIEIATKKDAPEVEKKILEGTNPVDATDVNIGDTVTFQITATLPSDYATYKEYFISFIDTLSAGLTYVGITSVTIDGTDVTGLISTPSIESGVYTFVSVDLKGFNAVAGSKIVLTYTATLNKDAVIGTPGNTNSVVLEYSNNPYGEGKGKTTSDEATVYTWEFDIFKYTGTLTDPTALAGAEFALYRDEAAVNGLVTLVELEDDDPRYVADANNYRVATTEEAAVSGFESATIVTPASGKVNIIGLESGTYYLKETKAPIINGNVYNLLTAPIAVVITASDADNEPDTVGLVQNDVTINVLNNLGNEFPETGGIGRTIFIIVGGVLMVGAAVVLIAKKKAVAVK